ncbi:MAG: hypothetical protein JSS55_00700 [Proteobacteria bacterium]|nr:hypothetical protein [Pseudomonadota bacterium]
MRIATTLLILAFSAPAFAADTKPQAGKAGGSDNPVVCKREVPIGSLIASRKVCLTKTEWEARSVRGNEEARRQAFENMARNPTPGN